MKIYFEEDDDKKKRIIPAVHTFFRGSDDVFKTLPFINSAMEEIQGDFFERVEKPEEADVFMLPYSLGVAMENPAYMAKVRALLDVNPDKKIVVFSVEDYFEDYVSFDWPEAIIFRVGIYRSERRSNEYGFPYPVEDLLGKSEVTYRRVPEKPVIGFTGWGRFHSLNQSLRSRAKDAAHCLKLFMAGDKHIGLKRKGLLLRIKAIKILEQSPFVKTNFIIRDRYGGSVKAQGPEKMRQARQEFIDNMVQSDVILSLRGEANASQRFYEVLSLGRIPVVIDTDLTFPYEDIISYEKLVISVPYRERHKIGEYIAAFFKDMTDEEYLAIQKLARQTFATYLSVNGFHNVLFKEGYLANLLSASNK